MADRSLKVLTRDQGVRDEHEMLQDYPTNYYSSSRKLDRTPEMRRLADSISKSDRKLHRELVLANTAHRRFNQAPRKGVPSRRASR